MERMEDRETAGLKFCHACNVEARNVTDRFCRRCGARHIYDTERLYDDPLDSPSTPHTDPISETVVHPRPQNVAANVTFGTLRRRLFSMLGADY
jgi:hypothetical protein